MSINIQGIKDLCVDNAGNIYLYFGIGPNEEIPKTIKEGWINKYSAEGELLDTFTIPDISLVDMEVPGGRIKFIDVEKRESKIIFLSDRKTSQLYRYRPVDIQDKPGFEVLDEKNNVVKQVVLPEPVQIKGEDEMEMFDILKDRMLGIDQSDNLYIYLVTSGPDFLDWDFLPEKVKKIYETKWIPQEIFFKFETLRKRIYKYNKNYELMAIIPLLCKTDIRYEDLFPYNDGITPDIAYVYKELYLDDNHGEIYQLFPIKTGVYIIKWSKIF